MEVLEGIRQFADKVHGTQQRKYSGQAYIVHPVAVMRICKEYTDDIAVLAAALLHDVLEDTDVMAGQLKTYLHSVLDVPEADHTFRLVQDLTDEFTKEKYPKLNRKERKRREAERLGKADPMAQTVKYADLIDNCLDIMKHDKDFGKVFLKESGMLLEQMTSGDQRLYERAKKTVEDVKKMLKENV